MTEPIRLSFEVAWRSTASWYGSEKAARATCGRPGFYPLADSASVRFWQDVARDLAIGRVYLPEEDLAGAPLVMLIVAYLVLLLLTLALIVSVARRFADIELVLFDLPPVAEQARRRGELSPGAASASARPKRPRQASGLADRSRASPNRGKISKRRRLKISAL